MASPEFCATVEALDCVESGHRFCCDHLGTNTEEHLHQLFLLQTASYLLLLSLGVSIVRMNINSNIKGDNSMAKEFN